MDFAQKKEWLLEDLLLASKGDAYWTTSYGGGDHQTFASNWNSDAFNDHVRDLASSSSWGAGLLSPTEPEVSEYAFPLCEQISCLDGLTDLVEFDPCSDYCKQYHNIPPMSVREAHSGMVQDVQVGLFGQGENGICKMEEEQVMMPPVMDESSSKKELCREKKSEIRKVEKQPSKNLMAERRRRKRLNERLSMLRSIVPKVSKMDRTSILGSTIDYMKDLLDKIQKLHEEGMEEKNIYQMNAMGKLRELKTDEGYAGSAPKFDVEKRSLDTRIELCCASKPGLLLSTLSTLEAVGLDIQHCVISCFSEFSVQAACSEVGEHRRILASEDVKQALFRNAGYGGKCL